LARARRLPGPCEDTKKLRASRASTLASGLYKPPRSRAAPPRNWPGVTTTRRNTYAQQEVMDQLEPIKVLGEGAFGKVYLMRHRQERTLQCVKVIKIKNIPKKEREACRAEVQLMKRLRHPNIVAYRDSFLARNRESLCIVMTYCDGGDLGNQITQAAKRRRPFTEAKVLHWFVQMALGLHYMHANRVLHRDLKTQNIFLLGNGRLVLGDLGISKVLEGTLDFAQTCIGTPYYMSPEIFKNKPYNHKSDIWALGCVLYECATLNHAFDANSLNGLACKIVRGKYPPVSSRYSKHLSDLVGAMLATQPSQRPTLEAILRRPFVRKHVRGFFADLVRRPSQSIGAGTRAVRAAAVCVAEERSASSPDVDALRVQLEELRMGEVIQQALNPDENSDDDPRKAQRRARERKEQLRREEDRKGAVEQALLRLRKEREARLRDRERLREEAERRRRREEARQRKPRVPRQREWKRPVPKSRVRASAPDARRERIVEPQRASVDQRRRDQRRDDEARRVRELERWENKQRAAAAERKRRVEAARPPNNGAARREAERARDNDAARRDRAREAERARQREIVEKLKADKLELDEAEARRQARVRQAAAAERRRAEADLLREQEEAAERRRVEAELLREQERRLAARLEAAKKAPPASPRVAEAKNLHDPSLAAKHAFSPRNDGLNARDRVLMRKRAAQEARERELNQALAEARQESAEQAQQAKAWGDAQYRSSMDSKLPRRPPNSPRRPPVTPPRSPEAKVASPTRWASPSPRRPAASPSPRRPPMTPDTPEPRRLTPDTPPQCPPTRDGPPTRDDDADLVLDSESEDEEAAIGFAVAAPEHIEDAEQDIKKREDELRAELELTSQRCEELRKSLHDTKARMAARDAAPVEEDESEDEGPAVGVLNAVVEEDESDDEAPVRVVPPQSPPRVLESPRTPHRLADAPSPSGRLEQRLQILKQRCVRAIGPDQFRAAYDYLKSVQDADDDALDYDVDDAGLEIGGDAYDEQADAETQAKLLAILGPDKVHLAPLVDQLLFMEESL
jgi:NIMA (never in mitosis gene a)-related kinase